MLDSKLLKNVGYNSIGELLARVPVMLAQILIAKQLGPTVFGIWTAFQLFLNYNSVSSFGFIAALAREEPLALGAKKYVMATTIRSTSFYMAMTIAVLLSILVCALPHMINSNKLDLYRSYSFLLALLIIVQQAFTYAQASVMNHLDFLRLSVGKLIYGVVYLLSTVSLIYVFGLYGALSAWVFSLLCALLYYFSRVEGVKPKLPFGKVKRHKIYIKKLFKVGFPIYLSSILKLMVSSIDKILVAFLLGATAFGFYSVANFIVLALSILTGLVAKVISPHFLKKIGEGNELNSLLESFERLLKFANELMSFFCLFACIFFWFLIKFYLREYGSALYCGQILIFSAYFIGVVTFFYTILIALLKTREMIISSLSIILSQIALIMLLYYVFKQHDITYYAGCSLLLWIIYSLLLYVFLASARQSATDLLLSYFRVMIKPISFSCLAAVAYNFMLSQFPNHLFVPSTSLLLFAVCLAFFLRKKGSSIFVSIRKDA